jgi:predicted PurR-regulated permease PerM
VSAGIVLVSLIGIFIYAASVLAPLASDWVAKAPASLPQIQRKLLPLKEPIESVARAGNEIEKLATPSSGPTKPVVEVKQHTLIDALYVQTPEVIASTVILLILLYFLLAYDGAFILRVIKLLPTLSEKKRAVSIANDIETQISRYLLTVTVINACLGTAVGTAVGLLGLPNPIMWGAVVFLLNFVPYFGALTGIICMALGAILTFKSVGYALLCPTTYFVLAALEGNFITPIVMGRSLTLNPMLVLLSLIFWGWLWGIAGIVVGVPILASFKIFCAHLESMEAVADFLS